MIDPKASDSDSFERPPLPDGVGGYEPGAPVTERVPAHLRAVNVPRPSLHPSAEEVSALLIALTDSGHTLVPVSDGVRHQLDDLSRRFRTEDFSQTIEKLVKFWKDQTGAGVPGDTE